MKTAAQRERDAAIVAAYQRNDASLAAIGRAFGVSAETVRIAAREAGAARRGQGHWPLVQRPSAARRSSALPAEAMPPKRQWNVRNRAKYLAHRAVWYAVKTGRLIRQPCARCGTTDGVHAHHDDYSNQLDVTWLCPPHHRERHRELRQAEKSAAVADDGAHHEVCEPGVRPSESSLTSQRPSSPTLICRVSRRAASFSQEIQWQRP